LRDRTGIHGFLQGQQTCPEGLFKIPLFRECRQGFWGLGSGGWVRDSGDSHSRTIELGAILSNMFDIDLVTTDTSSVVFEVLLLFVHELSECLYGLYFDMRHGTGGSSV
jgi:hypothetical protein